MVCWEGGGEMLGSFLPEQVSAINFLFAGTVPANKFFFTGSGCSEIQSLAIHS